MSSQGPPRLGDGVFDLVVVVSSAGGASALINLLSPLPPDFPAAIVIVQHLDRRHRSHMAELIVRLTGHKAKQAVDGEMLRPGWVYLAPPDRHLLMSKTGTVVLSDADLVRFLRPSGDLMFESAAVAYGERVIAVVLTGTGSDGSRGVEAVKRAGGTVVVQDAATAQFAGMPAAAIGTGAADLVLPLDDIGPQLVKLTSMRRVG